MYDHDVLENFDRRRRLTFPEVPAEIGMVVEDAASGFCGDIVRITFEAVTLRSRHNHQRHFRWAPGGFRYEGNRVTLVRSVPAPASDARSAPKLTASGSIASSTPVAPQVARASRIWVEGRHDAELVEHVWGDELRELGIVVEPLHGADHLEHAVRSFGPSPTRRLGVLLDHLVDGSKEARLAASVRDANVLVTGHPFVDVWAGIRPQVIGLDAWPEVARGVPWKEGLCAALGVPFEGFWPRLRNRVKSYVDLRPELAGAVERLIDFVADLP